MGKCCFHSKRLDAELIHRGHDIRHNRYPIGYQEAPLAYDAVWSVALAFNKTMERLSRKDTKRSLKEFTYTDGDIAGEIYAAMNSTSFLGVSVRFSFRFPISLMLLFGVAECENFSNPSQCVCLCLHTCACGDMCTIYTLYIVQCSSKPRLHLEKL